MATSVASQGDFSGPGLPSYRRHVSFWELHYWKSLQQISVSFLFFHSNSDGTNFREVQSRLSMEKKNSKIRQNRHKKDAGKKPGQKWKIIRWFLWACLFFIICGLAAAGGLYAGYRHYSEELPNISSLRHYRPPGITTVYSDDNIKIAEFFRERRIVMTLPDMPEKLIHAFIASEDARFFTHKGIDYLSILRAFFKNIEAGTVVQGGSTITQQVIKCFLLTSEKKYSRKIKEAILAYRIDKAFDKERILYLYLNQIYLGHGAHGVGAAAENYFGKSVQELNLAECAMLAGLPQAPSKYSPFTHFDKARKRQKYVLGRMLTEGYISQAEAEEAEKKTLEIRPRKNLYIEKVPFYTEHVRRHIEKRYGRKTLYEEGLSIYTAVSVEMQETAQREVDAGLRALDKRQGYRGILRHISPGETEAFSEELQKKLDRDGLRPGRITEGIVTRAGRKNKTLTIRMGNDRGTLTSKNMRWAGKKRYALKIGDVVEVRIKKRKKDGKLWELALEQPPKVQGALLCIELGTGHVKAMVGGRDFRKTQFNRAVQSRRQPGSAFKPIIYSAAIDKGYTPATEVMDNAMVYKKWKPKNYDRKFYGPTLLRKALAKSRNLAAIQLLDKIGVDYAVRYARKLGITSELHPDLSLALGSSGVSLLEMVKAYSVFANYGSLREPVFITRILDRDGNEIYRANPRSEKVIGADTAYITTSLLESVVKEGTGKAVKALDRPAAGKTGTTNNQHDAWFVGYTPQYVTGAWVGFDKERSLGRKETGGKAAIPIWLGFMKKVLEGKPALVFSAPADGIVFSQIDADTGLLPIPESRRVIYECFKDGTAPTTYTERPDAISDADAFFKSDL